MEKKNDRRKSSPSSAYDGPEKSPVRMEKGARNGTTPLRTGKRGRLAALKRERESRPKKSWSPQQQRLCQRSQFGGKKAKKRAPVTLLNKRGRDPFALNKR